MDKYYFTDTIYLKDSQLYYEDKKTNKKVTKYNWHNLLSDWGWEKLNIRWIKKLNNYLKEAPKNSQFGVLDCGGDGDCLFHCLSYALKSKTIFDLNKHFEVQDLRKMVSDSIDYEKYQEIINIYKILADSNDFEEFWDPHTIEYEEFKDIIIEGGDSYWGDNILINILKEKLDINIIILNSNSLTNQYNYYPLMYDFDENLDTVILSYEDEIHFKLIGYFNGKMITCFDKTNVPIEIFKMINFMR